MEKLAFVDALAGRDRFYLPLMEALGPRRAVYYYRPPSGEDFGRRTRVGTVGFEQPGFEATLDRVRDLGIETVADDEHYSRALAGHDYFLTDFSVKEFHWDKHPFCDKNKRHICYTHSADDCPGQGVLSARDLFLATTEEMLHNFVGPGKFLCAQDGTVEVGRTPAGAEGVVVGLLHVGPEVLALGRRDRGELRAELAERLGVEFKPGLPLLSYMMTIFADARAEDRGLERLARRANIVVKAASWQYDPDSSAGERPFAGVSFARGENIFHTRDGSLNWLMRYAADVNLTNPMGAGNLTAVLLGLRQITTYTRQIMGVVPPQPINFSHLMRDTRRMQTKLGYCVAPIPIEATEMLLERIDDADYWRQYDREIGRVAKALAGRYWLGQEARDRAAMYIERILDRGTLTPSPQELPNAKVGQGPVSLGFPLDVTL